ncbi:MAG: hypothetical protein ABIF04_06645, partial [Chloroflexota bacterium]
QPPGGYIYQDEYWLVCHAPVNKGSLGTLFIESRRHLLDFAEMNADETASYGVLLNKVYAALKPLTGAERIYLVAMMEGIAHFHSWLVPRQPAIDERGVAFLAKDLTCELAEAEKLSIALRERLS